MQTWEHLFVFVVGDGTITQINGQKYGEVARPGEANLFTGPKDEKAWQFLGRMGSLGWEAVAMGPTGDTKISGYVILLKRPLG